MIKIKKFIIIYLPIFILLSISLFYLYPKFKNKYYSTVIRLRLIESKLDTYEDYLIQDLESYQNTRNPSIAISEIKDNIKFNWKELKVPWDKSKFEKTKALTTWKGNLIVGLAGIEKGSASIYLYNGKNWTELLERKNLVNKGLEKLKYVTVLKVHNGELFAGIDNTVWKYNKKNEWVLIKTFKDKNFSEKPLAYSMESHNGFLYVGLLNINSSIYRFNNSSWEDVSLGLAKHPNNGIYELFSHSDGKLYASNISTSGSTVVYYLDEKNIKFNAVGGKGINGSWINNSFKWGLSFSSHKGMLFLTMLRHPIKYGNFSSIWAYDGKEWFAVGNNKTPSVWGEVNCFNSSLSYKGMLLIGAGGSPAGNASVWALDNNQWNLIGGKGINQSWGKNFPHSLTKDFRNSNSEFPYRMIKWNNSVVVGFGHGPKTSTLWQLKIINK